MTNSKTSIALLNFTLCTNFVLLVTLIDFFTGNNMFWMIIGRIITLLHVIIGYCKFIDDFVIGCLIFKFTCSTD